MLEGLYSIDIYLIANDIKVLIDSFMQKKS